MSNITNPLDIIKRLDVKQNVTIRIIDEPTGKVVQEHVGHNAATNSLLTGIAHYLMGDGVLNQGSDTLMLWVPQYISLGTMGLTSQDSETYTVDGDTYIVPAGIGYTPVAPASATEHEADLNAQLRFTEYINQAPGFGADGYDSNTNNDREWFGLGYPYSLKPNKLSQDFYDAGSATYTLSSDKLTKSVAIATFYGNGELNTFPNDDSGFNPVAVSIKSVTINGVITTDYSLINNHIIFNTAPANGSEIIVNYLEVKSSIISVVTYPYGVINQDIHDTSVVRSAVSVDDYDVIPVEGTGYVLSLTKGTTYTGRIAVIYTVDSKDAANCELISAELDSNNKIVPLTLRSKITYRDLVPEISSEIPNTLDVVYSAMVSTGALKDYRGDNNYIYITEAGLWSKPYYSDSGDNGLLAGYRIMPTDDEASEVGMQEIFTGDGATTSWEFQNAHALAITSVTVNDTVVTNYNLDTDNNAIVFTEPPASGANIIVVYQTTNSWKDMTDPENRRKVQQNILRIGVNQVAQVVWKIQLGGLEQLNGLRYLYPSQYPEEVWEIVK